MVVDNIVEVFRVFFFVPDWYKIVDFLRGDNEVIHDRDSDFVELEWDGYDEGVSSNGFVSGILRHDGTLDDFEWNRCWIECVDVAFVFNDLDDFHFLVVVKEPVVFLFRQFRGDQD